MGSLHLQMNGNHRHTLINRVCMGKIEYIITIDAAQHELGASL